MDGYGTTEGSGEDLREDPVGVVFSNQDLITQIGGFCNVGTGGSLKRAHKLTLEAMNLVCRLCKAVHQEKVRVMF